MAWYDTGTVSVTNGSTTVTGAGTNFITGVQIGEGFSGPDGRIYEIEAVISATALTLADPYLGATQSGQAYKIVPTQSLVANLASQVSTLISDFQGVVDEAGEGKFDDGTATSAGITFLQDQDTGIFRPAANQIGFTTAGVQRALVSNTGVNVDGTLDVTGATTVTGAFTSLGIDDNAAATAITIDASKNVGIGTASPDKELHVSQSGTATVRLENTNPNLIVGSVIGSLEFEGNDLGASGVTAAVRAEADSVTGKAALVFDTGTAGAAAERMRIDSSGSVLVGVSTAGSQGGLTIRGAPGTKQIFWGRATNASTTFAQEFSTNNLTVGFVAYTNSGTTFSTTSDYRVKDNITPIQGAGDIVKAMRPATYTFKADGSWSDGFIAHELQELLPVAVSGEKDAMKDEEYEVTPAVEATYDAEGVELTPAVPAVMGTRSVPDYQGVDYSKLTPILTAALQEALNKIDALEARVAALEP